MADLDLEAFAHTVAHDLGAPLRGISIHLKLLQRSVESGDTEGAVSRIDLLQDRLRTMDAMMQRVRGFSKVVVAGEADETDLREACQFSWERLEAKHTLTIEGDGKIPLNPLRADMVLTELLRNAVVHDDREEGVVTVRIGAGQVEIIDEGPGLPGDAEDLMQPWAKSGPHAAEGHGTGLALARYVLKSSDCTLQLASGERGVTATVGW